MSAPKRFLLVRTDRLGDVVLTLPAASLLRAAFPDAHISLLLRRYTGALVEGSPSVDAVIWYDGAEGPVPFFPMVESIRRGRFDTAIAFHPTPRLAWLLYAAGIQTRIGSGYRWYSFLFTRRVMEHRRGTAKHELDHNLRLLEEIGCRKSEDFCPDFGLAVSEEDIRITRNILKDAGGDPSKPYAVIHPGSGGSAADWPAEKFGELARMFEEHGIRTVVTGTGSEHDLAAQVVEGSGGRSVSLAGRVTLKELAALLKGASVCAAPSTGPIHLAVAVGTPVVGLYPSRPPINAARWGPYGKRAEVVTPADGGNDLSGIPAEEVFAAVERVLAEHASHRV